jgi:hypothetical protein
MRNKRTAMLSDSPALYIEASLSATEKREKPAIGSGNGLLSFFGFCISFLFFFSSKDKKARDKRIF